MGTSPGIDSFITGSTVFDWRSEEQCDQYNGFSAHSCVQKIHYLDPAPGHPGRDNYALFIGS